MTAQLSRILADYLSDESRVATSLPFVLEAINNNKLLNDENNDEAVKRKWSVRLNALLGSKQAATRWAAITLIKETCLQSESLFVTGVQSWTTQLLGILGKPETTMVITIAIETQSILFEKTIGKPELVAEITQKSLPRFNQLLIQHSNNLDLMTTTLPALAKNTELFPNMSRHIADQMSKLYVSCLEKTQVSAEIVGRCLAVSCRTSGKTNFAAQWQETLMLLIGSVHQALNQLFDSVDEEDTVSKIEGYSLSPVSNDYVEAFPVLLQRIRYLQEIIANYLTSKTMGPVSVPVAKLMTLCCRIYNVYNGCVMREYKPKDEYTCLMTCLPELHLSTNKLLASLLLSSDAGLAQYGKLLARILLRLLSENKNKRAVKISVYNLISLCLRKFGYAFAETVLKTVATSAIQDLKANERKTVAVTEKVAGKKRRADQISSDAFSNDSVSYQPIDIQLAALETLQDLLTVHGNAMDMRSSIDTIVVSRILQGDADPVVKNQLYKCLLSSITSPNINQATLLPHAVRIFSAGLNDETHELRVICTQGLAICDLCMHTRMPPIQRAVPRAPVSEVIEKVEMSPVRSPVHRSNVIRAPVDDDDEDESMDMTPSSALSEPVSETPSETLIQPTESPVQQAVESPVEATTIPVEEPVKIHVPVVEPVSFTTPEVTKEEEESTTVVETSFTSVETVSTKPRVISSSDSDDDEFEIPEINMDD